MICEICKKEMKYFVEKQTCGWKCTHCDNSIVTTYTEEIEFDKAMYTITVLPDLNPSAIAIKNLSKACNCSFLKAKEYHSTGVTLGEHNAKETREILQLLKAADISHSTKPEFIHPL